MHGGWKNIQTTLLSLGLIFTLSACDSDPDPDTAFNEEFAAATDLPFVAIRVEAENYSGYDQRWHLINSQYDGSVTPDPDPSHHSTAHGNGYMELLPDTKVTHGDEFEVGTNFWGDSNNGPYLSYMLDFPEPGRYVVWTKAFSTGTEDNGIHVGFNDQKPESGKRIQLCSGKEKWTWSSAQRTNENHCGVEKTIFLDIPTAGNHEVVFYAREDGFEIDQFAVIKDPEDGLHECGMYGDQVRCKEVESGNVTGNYDLPITPVDGGNVRTTQPISSTIVDLGIEISVDQPTTSVGDELTYTLFINNNDNNESATNVAANVALNGNINFIASDSCSLTGNNVQCGFSEITPNSMATVTFTATASEIGTHRADAQVIADQDDRSMGNNAASVEVQASPQVRTYDAAIALLSGSNMVSAGDATSHLVVVSNIGLEAIADAELEFNSATLVINAELEACDSVSNTTCTLQALEPGQSVSIPLSISTSNAGVEYFSVSVLYSADENTDNNSLSVGMRTADTMVGVIADGALNIEAEELSSHVNQHIPAEGIVTSAWFAHTNELAPGITPDYDNTSPDSASNTSYIELLPDTRTGSDDVLVAGNSNFTTGDEGPALSYQSYFTEAGQYTVNARIRANNEQDAAIHVGLDGQWPDASSNIAVCNPDGNWQWTQARSVEGQCSAGNTATLDIPTPGVYRIMVSAATDGVELDKLVLSQTTDLPDGLGGTPVAHIPADIDLWITSDIDSGNYTVQVVNPDPVNPALAIDVTLTGAEAGSAELLEGFDSCVESEGQILCKINYVQPGSTVSAVLPLPEDSADTQITAFFNQANDPNPDNNSTVASGGGALNLSSILVILLLSGATRRRIWLSGK